METTNFGSHAHSPAKVTAAIVAVGGHLHIHLDQPATTDAAADTVLEAGEVTAILQGISAGAQYLIVQGGDENHKPYAGMKDSIAFTVK